MRTAAPVPLIAEGIQVFPIHFGVPLPNEHAGNFSKVPDDLSHSAQTWIIGPRHVLLKPNGYG